MFAAAAVAAAAALTAITTTQTCDPDQIQIASNNGYLELNGHSSLSWAQYATQRRNSLQRRKIELNLRLQKTTNNPNNPNASAVAKTKNNIQKEIEQLKLTIPVSQHKSSTTDIQKIPKENSAPLQYITQIHIDKEHIQEEAWFKELSAKVCNEFIKIHEMNTDLKKTDIDANLTSTLTNPTYGNFKELKIKGSDMLLKEGSEFFANTDRSEINTLLLEYIQSHGHELINEKNILGQIVSNIDGDKIKVVRPITAKQQKIIRSYEEKVHYRWDPRWLRIFRKRFCIPVAFVTLFFVLFTSIQANWVYVNDNERAGLWFYCNKTTVKSDGSSPLSSPTIASRFTTKMKHNLYNSNELLNPQLNNKVTKEILLHGSDTASSSASSTLNTRKLKDNKDNALFHEKSFKTIEKCYYFKFYFKDNHLAILFLALVGLIFHCIGFGLLIYGMFFSTSNRTLYFFHSGGECLVTSALINGLDLLVFWVVVASQGTSQEPHRTFKFGSCFYTNLLVMLLTLGFSSMLYLDDVINEYSQWKIKQAERNRRKAQMFAGTRKALRR